MPAPRPEPEPAPERRAALCAAAACLLAAAAAARALEQPTGAVVLTLRGRVRGGNGAGVADFDMAMLERMPQTSYSTRTPWYAQPRRFTGPLLRDVLAAADAHGSTLRMVALNDYRVDLPWQDAQQFDVIVARLLDDRPMAVRDKGPLFIMYPFDAQPELGRAIYFNRAAWQLRAIEVL